MCGIVGLFFKNAARRSELGRYFAPMLIGMSERGPDSAGLAVYREDDTLSPYRITMFHPDPVFRWNDVTDDLRRRLGTDMTVEQRSNHAVVRTEEEPVRLARLIAGAWPDIRVMGYGRAIEIFKDMGTAAEVSGRYGLEDMTGTHAIGHTRMATESEVTTEHSHPFIADEDVCLVHNGSLSNHNRLREWLKRRGMVFETDNDTEVAARYFAYRLQQGVSLGDAMRMGLRDLDGFFTFAMGTRNGFAVLRDGFACKPAVLAENQDWVAMASEFRSLAHLPGIGQARIWEPEPEIVYDWNAGSPS